MATLTAVHAEIQRAISRYLGYGRSAPVALSSKETDINDAMRMGLRQFYYPPIPSRHTWSFLYPHATLETEVPYSTGTVTVATDAGGSIVTLTGGTFLTTVGDGWRIRLDGTSYDVLSRTSGTEILLVDDDVEFLTATEFELGQNKFLLPADFLNFNGPLTYQPGTGDFYPPIAVTDEASLRTWEQVHEWSYRPMMAALIPKELSPDNVEPRQRWYLQFAPTPDAEYRLQYRYLHDPEMVDSTNVNHWGGTPHSNTIILSCLAAAESMLNDGSTEMHQRFLQALSASIEYDRITNAPDNLGVLYDPSEGMHVRYPHREEALADWRRSVPTVEPL